MKQAFMTQSAKDEAAALVLRIERNEVVDKNRWFDVPDSLFEDDDGNEYYNVQARFADIPVLNVEKSKAAKHNVYDIGIVLHTKVLRQTDSLPAIKNGTSHVMRFDKGEDLRVKSYRQGPDGKEVVHYDGPAGMGKEAFDAAVKDIMRCYDAWVHFQKFRKAPVHPLEAKAMEVIDQKPLTALGQILVDAGDGRLEVYKSDDEEEDEDPRRKLPPPVRTKKTRGKKAI